MSTIRRESTLPAVCMPLHRADIDVRWGDR